jgi:hypothetical protein
MPAQVYAKIANPFMPQGTSAQTNSPTPFYAPGEIGCAFYDPMTGFTNLRVRLDSGATSATPTGAVAKGQLAFWKDRANNLVTNDQRFADSAPTSNGFVNRVAGIFQLPVSTAANTNDSTGQPITYVCDLVILGQNVNVFTKSASATIGCLAVCDTTANTAQVAALATATTAPTGTVIGVFRSSTITSNLAPIDVELGFAI